MLFAVNGAWHENNRRGDRRARTMDALRTRLAATTHFPPPLHPRRPRPRGAAQLVKRLARIGVNENVPNLRNKLARGRFSAGFLLQVITALGAKTIDLDEALTDLATTN